MNQLSQVPMKPFMFLMAFINYYGVINVGVKPTRFSRGYNHYAVYKVESVPGIAIKIQ